MAFEALLAFAGAMLGGGLAIFVLLANPRLFVHRAFASAMSALVLAQICAGMGAQAALPADIVRWEYLRLLCAAFIPGTWLLFSVHFACANSSGMMAQWRWVIRGVLCAPFDPGHRLPTRPLRYTGAYRCCLRMGPAAWLVGLWVLAVFTPDLCRHLNAL